VKAHPQAGKQHPIEEPGGPQLRPARQGQAGVSADGIQEVQELVDLLPHGDCTAQQKMADCLRCRITNRLALLATAPPEQADQLVERWEKIAEHGEGTPATDNFYFRCAMERCAAELKATFLAIAPPEQARIRHATPPPSLRNPRIEPESADQPQATSGALDTAEPWLFAIAEPDGSWHDGEQCVFGDAESAQDEVNLLNDDLKQDTSARFMVVPLYRLPLAAHDQRSAEPVTPQMMSEVFAKSINNTDPEHDHLYDHRIAAAELNRLLAAHDQKVRREVLPLLNFIQQKRIYILAELETGGAELVEYADRAIRSLASGAEEKK